MTELQRSLSEAHGEATGAREAADKVKSSLHEAQTIHKRVRVFHRQLIKEVYFEHSFELASVI